MQHIAKMKDICEELCVRCSVAEGNISDGQQLWLVCESDETAEIEEVWEDVGALMLGHPAAPVIAGDRHGCCGAKTYGVIVAASSRSSSRSLTIKARSTDSRLGINGAGAP